MTKKIKLDRVYVGREQFLNIIRSQIDEANESIREAQSYIASYIDLFQKVETDKCKYNLRYCVTDDGLEYERTRLKKIGF